MKLIIWFVELCVLSLIILGVIIDFETGSEVTSCVRVDKLYSSEDYNSMKTQIFGVLENNCDSSVVNTTINIKVVYIFDSGWVEDDYNVVPCEIVRVGDVCKFETSKYELQKSMRYDVKVIGGELDA